MENITVVGAGYVGLANSFVMGISRSVTLIDINEEKIELLKSGISPINDDYINRYISRVNVNYTTDKREAYSDANYVFVATDTNYDDQTNKFNLKSVEGALEDIATYAKEGTVIVIKSTIPIGFTDKMQEKYPQFKLFFSPEFLREGFALYDNLNPDRIVVGGKGESFQKEATFIATLLEENTVKKTEIPVIYTSNREAEVVKLFANTYLAMRVAFVNELDTFCQTVDLETANVLDAIGYDHRIGRDYWNPSFGYGGYCLPKDTKQLKNEYKTNEVPEAMISNIITSNQVRKSFIADQIAAQVDNDITRTIGIYRVVAKKGINNFRSSAVVDIALDLKERGFNVVVYEPFADGTVEGLEVIESFKKFENDSDVIVANRREDQIAGNKKVYTVDVYNQY
ncbi:nucleotide sugar dehydrogenase [Mollicutes bacterium LVI A0078]|nr:nucleotide sugar dehydrogenase [Mollicutes bacterium LVI A0075]WOO91229.1 nucleotide sugar dehydrogenase [Mollicutes bacterium LVI A0078]